MPSLLILTDHEVCWDKPIAEAIWHLLPEKTTKKEAIFRYCKNEDCDYKISVGNPEKETEAGAETTAPVA